MTNKINGIDVSECSYYNKDNEPYCCEIWENECEAQNCYYKQLRLAKQKNDRLENLLIKRLNVYQRQKKKLEQIIEIVKNNQFCQQLIDIKNIILESKEQ